MTYGEKKRFLEGYCSSIKRIKGLQRELDEWYTIATNITQKLTPTLVKNSDNQSRVENCAIRIASIQTLLVEEIEQAEYNRGVVQDAIQEIHDSRRRDLMEQRYIQMHLKLWDLVRYTEEVLFMIMYYCLLILKKIHI